MKHLLLNTIRRKERTQVEVVIRRYDPGMEWPVQTNIITLKYLELSVDHLPRLHAACTERELEWVLSIFSCGLKNIPDVSLL